jgi:hypothetical protein
MNPTPTPAKKTKTLINDDTNGAKHLSVCPIAFYFIYPNFWLTGLSCGKGYCIGDTKKETAQPYQTDDATTRYQPLRNS